jgi:transcriptional regulator with XRE-family HTH domain
MYLEIKARLAVRIRQLREQRGWSQAEAADRGGFSRPQLAAIETCVDNPTFVTLARLADMFGVDAAELIQPVEVPAELLDPSRRGRRDRIP